MTGGVFYAAVTLTVPADNPNFVIDQRPGPGSGFIMYNRDKTTLYYTYDYSRTPFMIPKTVSRIYDAALVNVNAPITLQDGNASFIIENNMLLTSDRTRLVCCADKLASIMEYKAPGTVARMDTGAFFNMWVYTGGGIPTSQPIRT